MTLYVESNFVLEIALGQEELASAEWLLAAAQRGLVHIALPSLAICEPFSRVTRAIRDRQAVLRQLGAHVDQLGRSAPHDQEVAELEAVPSLIGRIDRREETRLQATIERLLAVARIIELDRSRFQNAIGLRDRFSLAIEDAIVLAVVLADLERYKSPKRHLFANRNRTDFNNPEIVAELQRRGCDAVWSFTEAARLLAVR